MVRLTGASLGFLAFAITVFAGISTGNSADATLERAMQAMFGFFALGLAVGWIACRVIDEHSIKQHHTLFPDGIPDLEPVAVETDAAQPVAAEADK